MTAPPIPDVSPVRRVALWWRGLVVVFTLAAVAVSVGLGCLVPAVGTGMDAVTDAGRERALVGDSAGLAARLADSGNAEQRQAVRSLLLSQIALLERIQAEHAAGTGNSVDDARDRAAWQPPDGALYRYTQALRVFAADGAGLPPSPAQAFAALDRRVVLQNERTRTAVTLAVAGSILILAGAVVFGVVSLSMGLRTTLPVLRDGQHDGPPRPLLPPPAPMGPAEMVAQALEQSQTMVIITTTTGIIEYANASFLTTTGYTAAEVIGQPTRILASGLTPRGTYRAVWDALLHGRVWTGTFCNRRRDGSCYWAQATITPVRDGTGRVVRYIAIEQDATRRLSAEDTAAGKTADKAASPNAVTPA